MKEGQWQDTKRASLLARVWQTASERGGEVLSAGYLPGQKTLQLRCQQGHIWDAPPHRILAGHWCGVCAADRQNAAKRQRMLERVKGRALERGGECLSDSYDYSGQKLRFRCSCGNVWEAKPADIVKESGSWCPKCFNTTPKSMSVKERHALATATRRRRTVERMHAIAKERGGECLTTAHHHHKGKFTFRCADGHTWDAIAGHIVQGKWCPACSGRQSRGEKLSRLILEALFDRPFPSCRPKWLRGSTGIPLELDCYNEEIGLAFEYQGHQHYGHQSMFHRDKPFERQAQRDEEKRALVANSGRGVKLVEIPYFPENITLDDAIGHIKQLLTDNGVNYDDQKAIAIDPSALYENDLTARTKAIVVEKGGRLLSPGVLGSTIKVKVECGHGHTWDVTPSKLMNGRWCPVCGKKQLAQKMLLPLEVFQNKAAEYGGKCLSAVNMGIGMPHEWECQLHGPFWARPRDVLHGGTWCPTCGKEKSSRTKMELTFARARDYATSMGGECLSQSYSQAGQKLDFRCSCGHEWSANPAPMLRAKTWCPSCGAKRSGFAAKRTVDGKEQMTIPGI